VRAWAHLRRVEQRIDRLARETPEGVVVAAGRALPARVLEGVKRFGARRLRYGHDSHRRLNGADGRLDPT